MWKSYLTVALRNIRKQRGYALLNVVGLAVGMACFLLIGRYVLHELSYDRFHDNADRIYRVVQIIREDGALVEASASNPFPVGPVLHDAYPDLTTVRFYQTFQKDPLIARGEKRFYESRFFFADSTVFDVFTMPFVHGDPETALGEPFSVVLTETTARRYFGTQNPVGRTLTFENTLDLTVTGVIEDTPANAHFQYDFLAAFQRLDAVFDATGNTFSYSGWYWNPCHTYVLVPEGLDQAELEDRLAAFVKDRWGNEFQEITLLAQPLTDIHLTSNLYQEIEANGNATTVYLFVVVAVFVLLIACINFMNLATARSMPRAREVGMRKVLGARRHQLVGQFIGEALILSAIAAVLAIVLAEASLPVFEQVARRSMGGGIIEHPVLVPIVIGMVMLVGLMAGSYPAFYLSRLQPVTILRGRDRLPGGGAEQLRRGLVVFQFAVGAVLIIGTAVVYQQLNYMQTKRLGFEKEHIVMVPIRGTAVKDRVDAFKAQVLRQPRVLNASAVSDVVGQDAPVRPFFVQGREDVWNVPGLFIDFDFFDTFDVQMAEGRALEAERATDSTAFILNETAATLVDQPLGKYMVSGQEGPIVGIAADFNFMPLRQPVRPLVISFAPNWWAYVAVRMAPGNATETLASLSTVWSQFEPERPFEPFFLDERLDRLYRSESTLLRLFVGFAGLAIFVACLGLFGLVAYAAEQRRKEVSIRKVLGASVVGIVTLLSKDFLKLVALAFVLAIPVAYLAMNQWLADFAYRVEISIGTFVVTGALALLIALGTVSYQSYRAATSNPADTLRTE